MLAQQESQRMGHNFVGGEHILLGLIAEDTGIAAQVLKSLGINLKDARVQVEKIVGRGPGGRNTEEIPFSPRAKKILELALEEARRSKAQNVCTENLLSVLLGLTNDLPKGIEVKIFEKMGVQPVEIFNEITHVSFVELFERKENPQPVTSSNYSPQDYQDFLSEVLQITLKSYGNPEVVYPFLEANLDKLDLNFANVLRNLATTMSEAEVSVVENFATFIFGFSNLIREFPLGNKAANVEISIAGYEIMSTFLSPNYHPEIWAIVQHNLGHSYYTNRIIGDKAENIEFAIAAYKKSLEVRTQNNLPIDWAMTQNNLGLAYSSRIKGDKAQNIESAIAAFLEALKVYTKADYPVDWAETQCNLSDAYIQRIDNKTENLKKAVHAYQLALSVYDKQDPPEKCKATKRNLSRARSNLDKTGKFSFRYWQEMSSKPSEAEYYTNIFSKTQETSLENFINSQRSVKEAFSIQKFIEALKQSFRDDL